jgi:hypothetical protein
MSGNHLYVYGCANIRHINESRLTIFVLVLKTRIEPAAVPMNMYFPDGSKRATVIADLVQFNHKAT